MKECYVQERKLKCFLHMVSQHVLVQKKENKKREEEEKRNFHVLNKMN